MKKKTLTILFVVLMLFVFRSLCSEELPRPSYDNSLIFSMTHSLASSDALGETTYMKTRFGNGLYAPLTCSMFVGADMDWSSDITNAGAGIHDFKNTIDTLVQRAESYGVGLHIVLNYGISRNPQYYDSAKNEDLRNAQWYSDNNPASERQWNSTQQQDNAQSQTGEWVFNFDKITENGTTSVNKYALTTMSRYARKLRNHLEAKVEAAFDYLQLKQQQHPGLLLVVSAPGEAEMNLHPENSFVYLQEYFCDFSPFAVLEFRDWLKHEGLYAPGEKYGAEGYQNGGSRYQGAAGLQNFNRDFGTAFTTWDLKYFHWDLYDSVDSDYSDDTNPDPNLIPVEDYTFDGMMPTSGEYFISGGFDPPRVMRYKGENIFWDLWQLFRETMVYHYVRDMATIARDNGFPRDHYYTHQIPADYLFGTRPDDPSINLNPRYYSSASPLWTADVFDDIGIGVTMYDINFGTWYARTSQYLAPEISSLSDNWGVMEYNPEVVPPGYGVTIASAQSIYEQMKILYDYDVHLLAFFKWTNTDEHRFKGTNREEAAKLLFDAVKDKARRPVTTVFTAKTVEGLTGGYLSGTHVVNLSWSQLIWSDLDHTWSDWGDFKEFVIYRGYTENFSCNAGSEIARITEYSYNDGGFTTADIIYYKVAGVNTAGLAGECTLAAVSTTGSGGSPVLEISRTRMHFGADTGGNASASRSFEVGNSGTGVLNWTAVENTGWFSVSPSSGINGGVVTVSVNAAGKTAGTYTGHITVSGADAGDSPQTVAITLTVYNSGADSAPVGSFETPYSNTTVSSSVPFTGWALDDIEVTNVEIYRREGTNRVYIGTAVRVEGARPDVESANPDYPDNSKAGWGYMMLTNFLPNGGNGTFTFYAVAVDSTGHEVTLGSKTVTVDNANAAKPFGAIDAPAQGGTASGSSYRNGGWVLTPLPNSIPTDGSTINIYVDGVYLGHPVYNIYRSDIASLFPGYSNSSGAHAYFDIDTTAFSNGVHTIYWTARDNAGNTDGIGSRYFTINNSNTREQAAGNRRGGPVWPPELTFPKEM